MTMSEQTRRTITVPMDEPTQRFYQGAASANEVTEAHEGIAFPDFQTRDRMFWFMVGALAGGKHDCHTQADLTNFVAGAATRAPHDDTDEED